MIEKKKKSVFHVTFLKNMKEKISIISFIIDYYQKQTLRYVYVLIKAFDDEKLKRVYLMRDELF